jgi:hypothetical protein
VWEVRQGKGTAYLKTVSVESTRVETVEGLGTGGGDFGLVEVGGRTPVGGLMDYVATSLSVGGVVAAVM